MNEPKQENFPKISSMISRINRSMRIFYDRGLEDFHIGWSQQFFLEFILEHPGVSPQMLTERFQTDKGTTAKVLKKLGAEGYLRAETDEHDRRIHHLYACGQAKEAVVKIKELHARFYETITEHLSEEQIQTAVFLLENMAKNVRKEDLQHE